MSNKQYIGPSFKEDLGNSAVRHDEEQTLTEPQKTQARNNIGLGSVATENVIPVAKGGTGATTATSARTNLDIVFATEAEAKAGSNNTKYMTPLRVDNYFKDASLASLKTKNIADTTGTLAVSRGGTGVTTVAAARTALGLGTAATRATGSDPEQVPLNSDIESKFVKSADKATKAQAEAGSDNDKWMSPLRTLEQLNNIGLNKHSSAGNGSITGGFTSLTINDGTKSSGTYTPTPIGGNWKKIINGGAFTLAAPAVAGAYNITIDITNNSTAGAITFTGFVADYPKGDDLTTTDGHKFKLHISKTDLGVTGHVEALQ